jgi:hypothetical protein
MLLPLRIPSCHQHNPWSNPILRIQRSDLFFSDKNFLSGE